RAAPTAWLDPDVAMRVGTGLQALCRDEGTTLFVTSHNMLEVERLCRRVVFLSDGRIVADGTPAEVAGRFGRVDLESVFLHLAEGGGPEPTPEGAQQTERPLASPPPPLTCPGCRRGPSPRATPTPCSAPRPGSSP